MISYQFIEDLFRQVLGKSKAIQGRFFICPKSGVEINAQNLDQVLTDAVTQLTDSPKYPLALMMPPRSRGKASASQDEMERFRITMAFLKTTYYENAQVQNANQNTQTSLHTIVQDWHDMKRSAKDFMKALDKVQRKNADLLKSFRLLPEEKIYVPVTTAGADRASGMLITFDVELFSGCAFEDYNVSDLDALTITVSDTHANHYS